MEDKEKMWDGCCPRLGVAIFIPAIRDWGNPRIMSSSSSIHSVLLSTIMSNFHDFLVERAMFPFPVPDENKSTGHIEIHVTDVERLDAKWKATHAVRDDTLVPKLCHALQDILRDMELSAVAENHLLGLFSSQLEVNRFSGRTDSRWLVNPHEVHVRISSQPSNSS